MNLIAPKHGVDASGPRDADAIATTLERASRDGSDWIADAYAHAAALKRILEVVPARDPSLAEFDMDGNFANWLRACDRLLHEIGRLPHPQPLAILDAALDLQSSMPTEQFRAMVAALPTRTRSVAEPPVSGEGVNPKSGSTA